MFCVSQPTLFFVDFISVYHVCFERVHHPACRSRGIGDYECAPVALGKYNIVFKSGADFKSVSVRHKIAQLGASYQSSMAVVSFVMKQKRNANDRVLFCSVPLSAGLGVVLVYVWLNVLSTTEEQYLTQYKIGCYAIAFSCVLNQITQGVLLVAQSFCFIKLKVNTKAS